MTKAENEKVNDRLECPVARFFSKIEKVRSGKSGFMEHMSRSRTEFLKAVRCLIDEKIEGIEKDGSAAEKKRSTRVKVE